jgi:hypothetical protein
MDDSTFWCEFYLPRVEVWRDCLTRVLRTKLSGDALARAVALVEKLDDLGNLEYWFQRALTLLREALIAELGIAPTALEIRREYLMEVLRTRLAGDVLERAVARVEQQEDQEVLSRWFKQALAPEGLVAELEK